MPQKYKEYKGLDLPGVAKEIQGYWKEHQTFEKSISSREGAESFVFYEGPPSANGKPGIHHVMGRTIKDLFCRYKTLKGYKVERKAGWDTHGLPIELGVEKELGITKEDIGKKISVEDYNKACREAVMRYTDIWTDLTDAMGYWVDMENPYVTYDNKYMETVWWLLRRLYDKGLLYKGFTIQPYSPAAGTGLSSHELNMPGSYRDVKDTSAIAKFRISDSGLPVDSELPQYFLAWTTTPWTLPSNTALAVGAKIDYLIFRTNDRYSGNAYIGVMAKDRFSYYFKYAQPEVGIYTQEGKSASEVEILKEIKGADLVGLRYEQLLDYALPHENAENAFQVIAGDFVTTEDGTGIVHIAPTFGADDMMVAKKANVPPLLVLDENGNPVPLVDLQGRFRPEMKELGGKYVKNEYYEEGKAPERSVDVEIAIKLKEEDKAFLVEKYEHNYPHCWRTDKPVLYYPLDSWFVKSTDAKDRLIALNKTINWKPKATGEGRFGNWLENLNDWNLSRSRFWGIPIPIWRTEDGTEEKCIGSVSELKAEVGRAIKAGLMSTDPFNEFVPDDMSSENYTGFDLHKNHVDQIILVSEKGEPMRRENDLIDVWFDSGSMPYAQLHYPFENKDLIDSGKNFPADFIAEGVDQTRGWFFTLHAIATMCFDSVAFRNVVSNGLVLDKNGQKMSKRLGNAADPFETLTTYGADPTRWYMISNAQPWDNLRFDTDGIVEVQRKFFGTLYNTYSFFALYANLDGFDYSQKEIPVAERRELDRWIISKMNSLIKQVDQHYSDYEPTRAARALQRFVIDDLSNWYVRLSRRIFWKGEYGREKIAAYQTLYSCLEAVSIMSSPIAPFFMDRLFQDLNRVSQKHVTDSVHLSKFPSYESGEINSELEARVDLAQRISSLVLGLRRKENIKVRQPLHKIMVPVFDEVMRERMQQITDIIKTEVNIKDVQLLGADDKTLVKQAKANFKLLGKRFGKQMKAVAQVVANMDQSMIRSFESKGSIELDMDGNKELLNSEEIELTAEDIPGWSVASDRELTVALDITLDEMLIEEGLARELVNKVQNLRKDMELDITDRISVSVLSHQETDPAIIANKNYICAEILAERLDIVESLDNLKPVSLQIKDGVDTRISIVRSN